jgi:hypothetical protein
VSVTVTRSGPGIACLAKALERIKRSDVLVGIPANKASRSGKGKGSAINSAELAFIHSKGSPLQGIPARPFLEPSIEANKQIITPHLEAAARAVMDQDPERAERELKLAGTVAANSAKKWFTDPRNNWAPNAPSTIRRKGSSKPLIDTGQLRRSIVAVVRENGKETDAT